MFFSLLITIVLYPVGTSTKAFIKGVDTWKKETIMKKVLLFY